MKRFSISTSFRAGMKIKKISSFTIGAKYRLVEYKNDSFPFPYYVVLDDRKEIYVSTSLSFAMKAYIKVVDECLVLALQAAEFDIAISNDHGK